MEVDLGDAGGMREDYILFSETPGYVIEVTPENAGKIKSIYKKYGVGLIPLGKTTAGTQFRGSVNKKEVFNICLDELKKYWYATQ